MATYYRWRYSELNHYIGSSGSKGATVGYVPTKNPPSTVRFYYSDELVVDQESETASMVDKTHYVDIPYSDIKMTSSDDTGPLLSNYMTFSGVKWIAMATEGLTDNDAINTNPDVLIVEISYGSNGEGENLVSLSSATGGFLNILAIHDSRGDELGYVYNTNPSARPTNGRSGDYWYDQRTTITSPTAPSGLTVSPNPITTAQPTVNWTEATSNVPSYSVNQYEVSYKPNTSDSWTTAGTTSGTSMQVTLPAGITSVQFRVRARDSNNQWGDYVTSDTISVLLSPTLTVPQMLMQGQQATVNWTAIEGADSYTLQRKANTDTDWTQVYSGTALTFSETVGTWTTVQYRVQAVFDGTPGGWATSAEIPVVSASALVISGQDGDLGTLVNDVPYSISTDTGNQITATITVNGAVIFNGNVGNSVADVIPVLDLINGEGTIVIEASVTASSGPVSAVRTWTYTKTMMTFPNAGSIAELTKDGKVMWPETLANAVRLPGGKTLDQVMGFPAQVYAGSYVGTGTYGADNPVEITFPFVPNIWWIFGETDTDGQYTAQDGSIPVPWGKTNLMLNADLTASYSGSTVSFYRSVYPSYNEQGKVYSFLGIKIG